MKLAIPKEIRDGETRVAASPDTVKKLVGMGIDVAVEKGAGMASGMTDTAFAEAGATLADTAADVYAKAAIVLKVLGPSTRQRPGNELKLIPSGAIVIGLLAPLQKRAEIKAFAKAGFTCFSMELVPRISRAQSMDALSSQSNLAGYKAVLEGANAFGKVLPMMMTAAGTIAPAKALILGAGVAGLQAIATARRLGAVVSAFDVRPAVKEQVQSLGAKFIEVADAESETAETAGGYAKEMSEDYKRKQRQLIHDTLKTQDMAITTALIPGRQAPTLITDEMVKDMKSGSVIVDLAAETGGNCELTEAGKTVVKHDVIIVGFTDMAGRVAMDASRLYARNLLNFVTPMIDQGEDGKGGKGGKIAVTLDLEDEVVKGALVTRDGAIVHPRLLDGDPS